MPEAYVIDAVRTAVGKRGVKRVLQHLHGIVIALERRQCAYGQIEVIERLLHVVTQDGMRTDFEEDPHARAGEMRDGIAEMHRFADVSPPIVGVELLAREIRARHRRYKPARRFLRYKVAKTVEHRTLDAVHV